MTDEKPLPEPPIEANIELRGLRSMPIDVERLLNSDFSTTCSDAEFRAGLTAWCRSWQQKPAGSLPNNDVALAKLLGFGTDKKRWLKVKERALHGFVLCSDGRLYHPVVVEKAKEAWKKRGEWKKRQAKKRAAEKDPEGDGGPGGGEGDVPPSPPGAKPIVTRDVTPPSRNEVTDFSAVKVEVEVEVERSRAEQQLSETPTRPPDRGDDDAALRRVSAVAAKVVEIAGADPSKQAKWHFVSAQVSGWLARGADPDLHIYPAIRSKAEAPGYLPPGTPSYFDGPIADAMRAGSSGGPPPRERAGCSAPPPPRLMSSAETPFTRAVREWMNNNRTGPRPRLEDYPDPPEQEGKAA